MKRIESHGLAVRSDFEEDGDGHVCATWKRLKARNYYFAFGQSVRVLACNDYGTSEQVMQLGSYLLCRP